MPELSRNQDTYTIKLTHDEAIQLRIALASARMTRDRALQPAAETLLELLEGATR